MQRTVLAPYYPKARLVPFAGWELPVYFSGIIHEHGQVRQHSGLFDICHMGKFSLEAPLDQLERLVPSELSRLLPGQAHYTLLLNEAGGILDDVIFYYQGANRWRLIVNAATAAQDFAWLQQHLGTAALQDESKDFTLMALQGPEAPGLLQAFCGACLGTLPRFGHLETSLMGYPVWLARTGYTGEDGFEILSPLAGGISLWQELLASGVTPCGLGSRDSLRLEAALHLYGQDMDSQTNPLEAGLGWVIHWEKGDFIGRAALERLKSQGLSRKLVGLEVLGRGIARPGYQILHEGKAVGAVTSGTLAPSLNRAIALGYVPLALTKPGTRLQLAIRNQLVSAQVVKRPFYRRAEP